MQGIGQHFRRRLSQLTRLRSPQVPPHHRHALATILISTLIGIGLSVAVGMIQPDDRIVAGNTAGTLSILLEIEEQRLLIGAGPSRSHAADLIGRSTRPWDREIDLLVLPGWDSRHVSGALGLLERRSISGVAIVGLPDEEPAWTLLEREIERQGVSLTYVSQASRIKLTDDVRLRMSGLSRDRDGAWIRLDHGAKRVDILDAADPTGAAPDLRTMSRGGEHILFNLRNQQSPTTVEPEILVIPAPHWQNDFNAVTSPYWIELALDEHVEMTLTESSFRIPVEHVQDRPD